MIISISQMKKLRPKEAEMHRGWKTGSSELLWPWRRSPGGGDSGVPCGPRGQPHLWELKA